VSPLIQYVPGDTLFHRLDPRAKIVFMLLMASLVFVIQRIWLAAVVWLTLLLLWRVARLPVAMLKDIGKALAGLTLFLFVVQALFYPGETSLIYPIIPEAVPLIGGIGRITLEGMLFAVLIVLRLFAMVLILPLVSLTTPVHMLTVGLVRMGLPYRVAYAMTTAINLIPVLQAEANVIVDAQRLRAMQVFEKGRFWDKLRSYPALVTPLVIGAMRRAQLIAVAMDSRAFGASKSRTFIRDIQMQASDWLFVGATVLYIVLAASAGWVLR
jgi:energy-coupling factor transport system permease protein